MIICGVFIALNGGGVLLSDLHGPGVLGGAAAKN
jgi:hypothetical protein